MKKLSAVLLVLIMVFCFVGCSNNDERVEDNPTSERNQSTTNLNENSNNSLNSQTINNKSECLQCGREVDAGDIYCFACGCFESGCQMPRKGLSSYCVSHSCLMCDSRKSYSGNTPYCESHKCDRCANVVVDGSYYCVAHKCQLCNQPTFGNTPYCSFHD